MNENIELLEMIYKNASMGSRSLTDLLSSIKNKDNKIKAIVSEEVKGYEKYIKESSKLLKKYKKEPKEDNLMIKMMSKMGIEKEVLVDNSDSAIAQMLIEGFTLGNMDIDKLITNYEKVADKKIITLGKDLISFGEEEIKKLKKYL